MGNEAIRLGPYETLLLTLDGELAMLRLNRPDKRNAITPRMVAELQDVFDQLREDPRARAVILTGEGKSFCAGLDLDALREISKFSYEENVQDSRRLASVLATMYRYPKPIIAAVNGPAVAGGCGLATVCDLIVAAPEARFGYTEVRVGFIAATVSVFLRHVLGDKHARDLLLSGRLIDAGEAAQIGLINEVVPADSLLDRARQIAASLLQNSPSSIALTKALLADLPHALDEALEFAAQQNARTRATPEFQEGVSAFLERRPPRWQNRPGSGKDPAG
ncbi:MAG: enoyl-CoA hydratase/isomerase family protein [Acidobacteria bacterium]|nr:enoyl-CoA hydratase/isomerase family protein [Acidobacteriota bacterium]